MNLVWPKGRQEEKNINFFFAVKIPKVKKETTIKIAAENIYRIFMNGDFVGYGPVVCAKDYTREGIYSLEKYASLEDVALVIEVVGNNVNTYRSTMDKPFFGCNIVESERVILQTNDFRAYEMIDRKQRVQRYSFQRAFTENYVIDAKRNLFYLGDFKQFPEIICEEVSGNYILHSVIHERTYPMLNGTIIESGNVEIKEPIMRYTSRYLVNPTKEFYCFSVNEIEDKVTEDLDCFCFRKGAKGINSYQLYHLGRNVTGFISINLVIYQKTTLYILFDEILDVEGNVQYNRDDIANVIKWELAPGHYNLLTFEPYTLQYMCVVCLEGEAEIENVGVRLFQNENREIKFWCADDELNTIFQAALHSFEQNSADNFMDCPSRERAGWLCDSYFTAQAEQLITGNNIVEKYFLENYLLAEQDPNLPEGMIPMCYPADHTDHIFIANYASWFVIELEDYYRRTGDKDFVLRAKAKVIGILEFFKAYENKEGLIERMDSWIFVEWSKCGEFVQDVNIPSNMLYSKMLTCAGFLYGIPKLIEQGKEIKKTINRIAWNGEFYVDHAIRVDAATGKALYEDNSTQRLERYCYQKERFEGVLKACQDITETCQYYALYFDIAESERKNKLKERMRQCFGPQGNRKTSYPTVFPSNAFIGNYLRLAYFSKQGKAQMIIKECKGYFLNMAKSTNTLWEYDSTFASCNHGFTSYTANLIVRGLVGFSHIDFKNKKIYFIKQEYPIDCKITIPLGNERIKVEVNNGICKMSCSNIQWESLFLENE